MNVMLVYLNGLLVPEDQAKVSVYDRGFLFGDGVYELVRYFDGVPVALDLHTARLARSLELVGIKGVHAKMLQEVGQQLLEENQLINASVYLQITRGAGATRAHMPVAGLIPTVFAYAAPTLSLREFTAPETIRAIVRDDLRWHRCEIKTIALAGNILSLIEAQSAGADECILIRDGLVSEGAYTNVAAVLNGVLVTCPLNDQSAPVLHGTMRCWMLDAAHDAGVPVEVRRIAQKELSQATEVLVQSSRRLVSSVTHLDERPVGSAESGPICRAIFTAMHARIGREIAAGIPHR